MTKSRLLQAEEVSYNAKRNSNSLGFFELRATAAFVRNLDKFSYQVGHFVFTNEPISIIIERYNYPLDFLES